MSKEDDKKGNDYQSRVIEEKKELDLKIKNLQIFLEEGTIYATLKPAEQEDLKQQFQVMNNYSMLLQRRINRF